MGILKIVALGVGDAFSDRYYSSGLWLSYEGSSIIIDCAHPIRKIMREASSTSGCDISVDNLDGVVITHLHADHAGGLEGLGFYGYFRKNRVLPLLAHKDVLWDIWPWHLKGTMAPVCDPPDEQRTFEDFFTPVILNEQTNTPFGPFRIACRRTVHHIPTYALKITAGQKVFGYSSDTSFDYGLIDWLSDSDLFVHETNVASHTPYEKLATLPLDIRRKMRLIHYPDDFESQSSVIDIMRQGELIRL
ncbi:MAG: MBL fold metallo-hydrolase [Deltaproteobacteria bacterium]|nr:MBL fold metallo-hydrolase [Deltaproteobacteria bacterium]